MAAFFPCLIGRSLYYLIIIGQKNHHLVHLLNVF
jgi:hypothetical protein